MPDAVDVTATRVIPLPPQRVAEYAMDWRHDHEWTQGIRHAELTTPAPDGGFGLGAEVTFQAHPDGTAASIRIRGDASGYYRLAGPLMTLKIRSSIRKDLRDLERRLIPYG